MAIIGVALATNAQTAERVVITSPCDPATVVGDVMFQSTVTDDTLLPCVNNTSVSQAIGVCTEKINATTCRVLILGRVSGFTGFVTGGRIFLSPTGKLTTTRPTSGYLHNLGVALSSTEALFIPNNIRVLQT